MGTSWQSYSPRFLSDSKSLGSSSSTPRLFHNASWSPDCTPRVFSDTDLGSSGAACGSWACLGASWWRTTASTAGSVGTRAEWAMVPSPAPAAGPLIGEGQGLLHQGVGEELLHRGGAITESRCI